jgi:hypothetical protein
MIKKIFRSKNLTICFFLLIIFSLHTSFLWAGKIIPGMQFDGRLRILTINLLFSEIDDRDERLEKIAGFVLDYEENYGEPVDVILLQ